MAPCETAPVETAADWHKGHFRGVVLLVDFIGREMRRRVGYLVRAPRVHAKIPTTTIEMLNITSVYGVFLKVFDETT